MRVVLLPVPGLPEVGEGDELGVLIAAATQLEDGDIVVVAQKIVSKSEGRARALAGVTPGDRARELAAATGKDPRLVQLILDESREVLRANENVLIVETLHGFICANAGIDASNVPGEETVLLLPEDSDASARKLRAALRELTGRKLGVILSDSFGRAWRVGQLDVAIGCAGLEPLDDLRGGTDREGRELSASIQAVADELAAAADLGRGKTSGEPVVVVRGRGDLVTAEDGPGVSIALRDPTQDLFR